MNPKQVTTVRNQLLTMFSIALSAVDGQHCTKAFFVSNPLSTRNVRAVAIGKAAAGMMQGAISGLGDKLRSGLVITKQGYSHGQFDQRITQIESDHPIPSERSLLAGQQLVSFIEQVKGNELLLMLISGGTSSLVEVLDEKIKLQQLEKLNDWCMSQPFSISQINAMRKSISKIKDGRLLNYINSEHVLQLTISDVEGNDLSVIGSGLLVVNDHSEEKPRISEAMPLPEWLSFLIRTEPEMQKSMQKMPTKIQHHILADNQRAREAISERAKSINLPVQINQEIYLELIQAADLISKNLIDGEPGLYIWGGECVLTLPDKPGQGGRCQSLALAIAEYINGLDIVVLVAGTDGSDGPGEAAGALIDGQTISRGLELGLDASEELQKANAGYYLSETGDLIDTGPTDTNVMDLIIALKYTNSE